MEFQCLGSLTVVDDGGVRTELGGPKQRLVLAVLLLHAGREITADGLVDAVWDDGAPASGRNSLHTYVSHLRGMLGAARIERRSQGYRLLAEPDEIDSQRFERLAEQARRLRPTDPEAAATALKAALDLWTGPPFADLAHAPALQAEIGRLEQLRLGAIEERFRIDLDRGLSGDLVAELEAAVTAHPLRERLWAALMLALYRSGRQGDALAAFDRARGVLVEELGVDPSRELQELQDRMLRQDPSLEPGAPTFKGYRLLERLADEPPWSTWRAAQPGLEREVAIRAANSSLANTPSFIRHFDVRVQHLAGIEHPHVLPVYDFWREPDGAFIVTRMTDGGDLRDVLAGGGHDEAARRRIGDQLLRAVAAAHRSGVVHGHITPAGVLLDEQDNVLLSDFLIAEPNGRSGSYPTASERGSRLDGARFLAPERVDGAPADTRSDVYTLGVLLAELLVEADATTEAILTRAVASDPAQRHDDAVALLAEVQHARSTATRAAAGGPPLDAPALSTVVAGPVRNPYKGLRAFGEADSDDFFGRRAVVARLLPALRDDGDSRFLAVVGPSGSGKSSAVRAGLVPALRAGALPGSEDWYVVTTTPGADPFDKLAAALQQVAVDPPPELSDALAGPGGLTGTIADVLPDHGELLIIIDQFEELYTLTDAARRRRFVDHLVNAVSSPNRQVRIVATLRADFYDRPLADPAIAELVQAHTETVVPMTAAELEAAITGPSERVGVPVERALVAQMVAEVIDRPGALPLLQYALTELFDIRGDGGLTVEGYRRIGGVAGALARRADAVLNGLSEAEREAARHLMLRLVLPGEGVEDTRRRVTVTEVTAIQTETVPGVLHAFGAARLLSFDRDPETREPTVEVAHEALLREWPRLRQWIDHSRDDLRTHRRLQAAAADWEAAGQDPSFLATGSRLDQYEAWRAGSGMIPTTRDTAFLDASAEHRDRLRAEEEARRIREQALERRSVRRLRVLVAVLSVAAVMGSALTIVAVSQARRAADQAEVAAEQANLATVRELAAASVAQLAEDPELSILLALEAVKRTQVTDGTVLPEAEGALHRAVTASRIVMSVPGLGGSVDWSPDGTVFVTEGPEESGLIDLRDAETGESVQAFTGHDADINDVAFSADGALLATVGDDGLLRVWDLETEDLRAESRGDGPVWGVSFSPDGSRVAAGWLNDGVVRILDLGTGEPTVEVPAHVLNLGDSTSFSPDGDRLAIADASGVVVVDAGTGDRLLHYQPSPGPTFAVGWSPNGRWIASASEGLVARVTDAETGERHLALGGHTGEVFEYDWSSDGSRLASGARDGTARVWEITEGDAVELVAVATRDGAVGGLAFSPDGERLLSGDLRVTTAKIWNVGVAGGAEWANLPTSTRVPGVAEFTPDGDGLVVTGDGVPAVVWDLSAGSSRRTLGVDEGGAWEIEVSPDGDLVATISFDNPTQVHVWNRHSGTEVFTVKDTDFFTDYVAWSPDGELLAVSGFFSSGEPGKIAIVDRGGRQVAEIVEDDNFRPTDVEFGPDGEQLVTARMTIDREDPTIDGVRVWDWVRGEVVTDIPVYARVVAIDPTGTRIAAADAGRGGSIWAAGTGDRLATLRGHTGEVFDVAFSPDGDTIATAGSDGTVRLWATESGTEQLVLHGHDGQVSSVAFGPEGDRLASTSNGVARVWALDLDDLVDIAESRLTRSLTEDECRQYLHVEGCPE